jgi:SP family facilitated glucose transporter-like MFS transporter 1
LLSQIFKEFISNSYRDRTRTYLTEDALELIWSITVAIFAIGGMIGGISGGLVADWCGR